MREGPGYCAWFHSWSGSPGWWYLLPMVEQTMGSKFVSIHSLCINPCVQILALFEFLPSLLLMMDDFLELGVKKPFPPWIAFNHGVSSQQ